MKEVELYPPVKSFLEGQGLTVKGEVGDCDVVAVKNDLVVVVELKKSLNLTLLLQAVDRQKMTHTVYVAVPNSGNLLKKQYRQVEGLLKRLGLGLLLVHPTTRQVVAVLDPCEYKPRRQPKRKARLLKEFSTLVGDPNVGGSQKIAGRMTAYRQRALTLARHLIGTGPVKASVLKAELNEPKAREILYRNVYGWFERHGNGIYGISLRGRDEVPRWSQGKA